jgi:hypothetical protein
MKASTGYWHVNKRELSNARDFGQRCIQVGDRKMLEYVGSDYSVELGITEHRHFVTATDNIRLKAAIDIKCGHGIPSRSEYRCIEPLSRSDYKNSSDVLAGLDIAQLVRRIYKVRKI